MTTFRARTHSIPHTVLMHGRGYIPFVYTTGEFDNVYQNNMVGFRADCRRGDHAVIQEPQRNLASTALPAQEQDREQPALCSTPGVSGGRPVECANNGRNGQHHNGQNGQLKIVRVTGIGIGEVIGSREFFDGSFYNWYQVRLLNTVSGAVVWCKQDQLTADTYEHTWKIPFLSETRTIVSYIRVKVG